MEEREENTTDIDSPDAPLSHLIFPCLDSKDLVMPVCKQLAECREISCGNPLYHCRFGTSGHLELRSMMTTSFLLCIDILPSLIKATDQTLFGRDNTSTSP